MDKAEELLASELRGSRSVEHVLGFTKRFFELSFYRVDVLEDLPRRMNMIRRDVREILDCLYYLEEEMSRIKMLLWDHKLWACIERQDVKDLLLETCSSDLAFTTKKDILSSGLSNYTQTKIEALRWKQYITMHSIDCATY